MVVGVLTTLLVVWVGSFSTPDREGYLRYALAVVPTQLSGLLGALVLLQKRGTQPAARFFGGFVAATLLLTSLILGAAVVSNFVTRLLVPTIVIMMALESIEAVAWVGVIVVAAWVGVFIGALMSHPATVRMDTISRVKAADGRPTCG